MYVAVVSSVAAPFNECLAVSGVGMASLCDVDTGETAIVTYSDEACTEVADEPNVMSGCALTTEECTADVYLCSSRNECTSKGE